MKGRSSACWAAESTFLLPRIPLRLRAQMKVSEIEIAVGESSEERVNTDNQRMRRACLSDG